MKKKKAYIAPEVRVILVEMHGVMADIVSKSKTDDNTGNETSPIIPTDPSISGGSKDFDDGKYNSGSLWDYDN